MTDKLPRDRYEVWRRNDGKCGTAGPNEPPWGDLSMSQQGEWIREVEPEFHRKIREQSEKDLGAFPYWFGGALLLAGTIWLANYFDVLGK